MWQEAGAIDGNVGHEHGIPTAPRRRDRHLDEHLSDAEGTELAAYPRRTDSKTSHQPIQERSDRKALLKDLWPKGLSLLVEPRACRDHLANERTFLAWLRTSLALSMTGIFTTQLFIIQSNDLAHMNLSFFLLGVPLGSVCHAAALVNVIVGAHRFWRHQSAMAEGQACAGGWEIFLVAGLITLIILVFLTLVLISDFDQYEIPSMPPASDIGASRFREELHALTSKSIKSQLLPAPEPLVRACLSSKTCFHEILPRLAAKALEYCSKTTALEKRSRNCPFSIISSTMSEPLEAKDHWSTQSYSAAASFVPKLTQKVLQYLDPQPNDRVLDLGCGDAKFTARYLESVAEVYGVDASPSFIASANQDYASSKARFRVVDCRYLEQDTEAVSGTWDKVVSNAALHWMLRDSSTRLNTLKACFSALKPGGAFVFEMGGAGNVAEANTALISAIVHQGLSIDRARKASPWFFPSEVWMSKTLEDIGFVVEILEVEYRPTELTTGDEGGLRGWVKLMGASMLEVVEDESKRSAAIDEVCDVLSTAVTRVEDDSQWLGYVRLRGVAKKP